MTQRESQEENGLVELIPVVIDEGILIWQNFDCLFIPILFLFQVSLFSFEHCTLKYIPKSRSQWHCGFP